MRIHNLRLINYRGVADTAIDFSTDGVTIVEGDNEVGKTSLSEAIDLLLGERDDSGKKAVKAVKPVDKDVGAEVEIEMSSGQYRFRYRKRWHKQRETTLQLLEPEQSQLTGRDAHDRVIAILEETLDQALWEALRLRQGIELDQSAFAGGSLGRALDVAAGGDAAGDREDDLWVRITAERERYWTAGGKPKVERVAAAKSVEEASDAVDELEAILASLEDDTEQLDRLAIGAVDVAAKQTKYDSEIARFATQAEAIQTHRNEVARLTASRDTAVAQRDSSLEISKARRELVDRVRRATEGVDVFVKNIEAARPEREQADRRRSDVQQSFENAKASVRNAEQAERRAAADSDYRRQQIELEQLTERRDRVVSALGRRKEAEAALGDLRIDDALSKRIEEAHLDFVRAEASATSAAAEVDTEALVDLDIEVDGKTVALKADGHHQIRVTETTRLAVPGSLNIVVTAGAEAQGLAERQGEAEERLASLCKEAGVADLASAREAIEVRRNAERVLDNVSTSVKQDLRDLTAEDLDHKVERLNEHLAVFESERSPEPPLPPDLDAAQVAAEECSRTLEERRHEWERVEKDLAQAQAAMQTFDADSAASQAQLEQARSTLTQDAQSLDQARQDRSDDDVATHEAEAASAVESCTAQLGAAEQELAAENPDAVDELLANARAVKKRLVDEAHENEMTSLSLRARLEIKGDEGLAQQLDAAKSELLHLANAYERDEARAEAAELLHDTFAKRRADAHNRYVAPFRKQIEQLGRVVFGPDLEVQLDEELRITQRTLNGTTLDFASLSTGAKEQLGMISRLACASIVAADEGAPVIFDDSLGWSDPQRLDRMGAVISMAGRSCQIIVLTCSPGRYDGVGNAKVIQL